MAEKHLYNLGGMRTAAVAFAVMAIATFAMQIERLLAGKVIAEFGFILVLILCWMAAMFGTRGIVKYRPEFAQAYRASMLAVLCTVVGAGMAFVLWHRGSGSQAFISFGPMLMMYTQMMAQLYAYSKILNGGGELCKKVRYPKKRNSCRIIWKPCVLIILLSQFAVVIAELFEGQTVYIVAGTAAALALIAHFLMIRMILSVHDLVDGRSMGQRKPTQGAQKNGQKRAATVKVKS